jgi:hypothetical protein
MLCCSIWKFALLFCSRTCRGPAGVGCQACHFALLQKGTKRMVIGVSFHCSGTDFADILVTKPGHLSSIVTLFSSTKDLNTFLKEVATVSEGNGF